MQNPTQKLLSIRFSHFVEKTRWAMDRLEVPYEESTVMPILHFFVTPFVARNFGISDKHSTRFSTPILTTDTGKTIGDSSKIVEYISERFSNEETNLYSNSKAKELDLYYNNHLAHHVRRIFYFNVLNNQDVIFEVADRNVSPMQAFLFKKLFIGCKSWILNGLHINKSSKDKSKGYIYKEFEEVEKKLRDGRPYLLGDRFTVADISFCCLGGAILMPRPEEGYGAFLPPPDNPCPELSEISQSLRNTDAGKFILRMFTEERGKRLIPSKFWG